MLIAPPGGGKSTTEKGLKARGIRFRELMFRSKLDREVDEKTEIGLRIDKYRRAGALVPNEIILPLVDEAFEEVEGSQLLLLDGFPRNIPQIDFAIERIRHFGYERIIALYIDTPVSTCIFRLNGRKRDVQDSDLENVAHRFQEFDTHTAPVITRLRHKATALGISYYLVDGENLTVNMDAYIRMLGIGWMAEK